MESDSSVDPGPSYAEVVKGSKSPLRNSWWFRYQVENEEEAIRIAKIKSVNEAQVNVLSVLNCSF